MEASGRAADVTFDACLSVPPSSPIKSFQPVCHLQITWLLTGRFATSLAGEKLKVRYTGFDQQTVRQREQFGASCTESCMGMCVVQSLSGFVWALATSL